MTDKDHQAFEDWMNRQEFDTPVRIGNSYSTIQARILWRAWQAAWSHQSAALAAAQEREAKISQQIGELSMLVRMLASKLPRENGTRQRAMDYLVRHDLQGSPFRAALSQSSQPPAQGEPAGWQQTLRRAVVLMRTVADHGCQSFYEDGSPTENRILHIEIAADLEALAAPYIRKD